MPTFISLMLSLPHQCRNADNLS